MAIGLPLATSLFAAQKPKSAHPFKVASFSLDVTVPLGHPCMGGGIAPARKILDPLFANGIVLMGPEKPVVLISVDWCEIRNDAYDRWREVIANAARTDPVRVLVSATHVHDAPVADLEAQRILDRRQSAGKICDLVFHEETVQKAALAVKLAMRRAQIVTHLGVGKARVEKVASNRRYTLPDGRVSFDRTSSTRNPLAQGGEEGVVDPWLKTLSFWNGLKPVAALSCYATHPMSYYGQGGVSSDFIGLARWTRQQEDRGMAQVYFSGCSGNVTAGKYNDGDPANRAVLAGRLYQGLAEAWQATRREELKHVKFASVPVHFEPRSDAGFSPSESEEILKTSTSPFKQNLAAMNLSWLKRVGAGRAIDVPMLDFGIAQFVLLPAEAYVEYQLYAQALRPSSLVLVAGYGESAPGYIPTDRAWEERDSNLHDWCWVAPGAEKVLKTALNRLLNPAPAHP